MLLHGGLLGGEEDAVDGPDHQLHRRLVDLRTGAPPHPPPPGGITWSVENPGGPTSRMNGNAGFQKYHFGRYVNEFEWFSMLGNGVPCEISAQSRTDDGGVFSGGYWQCSVAKGGEVTHRPVKSPRGVTVRAQSLTGNNSLAQTGRPISRQIGGASTRGGTSPIPTPDRHHPHPQRIGDLVPRWHLTDGVRDGRQEALDDGEVQRVHPGRPPAPPVLAESKPPVVGKGGHKNERKL